MHSKSEINKYILELVKAGKIDKDYSLSILKEVNRSVNSDQMDIAIVGMACRLPFANNVEQYWINLLNGFSGITLKATGRQKKTKTAPTMKAGYMQEIDKFDAAFFRIPPREAILMHPLQRLFLENVWESIEDAGLANKDFYGSNTGVFLGIDTTCSLEYKEPGVFEDILVMTGEMKSLMASRLSYIYDLKGPSFVIDSACSSGLVSLHLAIDSLKKKECSVAVAGGINLITNEIVNMGEVEAKESKLGAFDKNSSGTVWGDGVANLVLKPLSQAIKDGDNIHGVIKGSALNNDGRTSGITAPNARSQADVILKAWENAKIDPMTVSYIEAHATGTVIGDPIEINGLRMAFGKYTEKKQFCGIGTVKPNIGHGVGVAGISSLIKLVLSMERSTIPPCINFSTPNPFIDFCNSPLYLNDRKTVWDTGEIPKRGGVSAFGFNRTNCHVVVEEAPRWTATGDRETIPADGSYCFTLSAKNIESLEEYILKYVDFRARLEEYSIRDICYTVNCGREHYNHRLLIKCCTLTDLMEKLNSIRGKGLIEIDWEDIYYDKHILVNTKTQQDNPGEITLRDKARLDSEAASLGTAPEDRDRLISLYLEGADLDWGRFYEGKRARKVSLPTYPFLKKRYWKESSTDVAVSYKSGGQIHPLVKNKIVDSLGITIYLVELDCESNWVLADHQILGMGILPGTGFIEICLGCGADYFNTDELEMSDIILMRPLVVQPDEIKNVHVVLNAEKDYTSFKIISSEGKGDKGYAEWVTHIQGKIGLLNDFQDEKVDLARIKNDFSDYTEEIDLTRDISHFHFGPHWNNITQYAFKENRFFSEIRINRDYIEDVGLYHLNPALFDNTLNMAVQWSLRANEEYAFLPFSFQSIKLNRRMPKNFYVVQDILNGVDKVNETIVSNVKLVDEEGNVFAAVGKYSLKKIQIDSILSRFAGNRKDIFFGINWIPDTARLYGGGDLGNVLLIHGGTPGEEFLNALEKRSGNLFQFDLSKEKALLEYRKDNYIDALESLKDKEITHIIHAVGINGGNHTSLQDFLRFKEENLFSFFVLIKAITEGRLMPGASLTVLAGYSHEVTGDEKQIFPVNSSLEALTRVTSREYANLKIKFIDTDEATSPSILFDEISREDKSFMAYRNGKRYTEQLCIRDIDNIKREEISLHSKGCYLITGGLGGVGREIADYLSSVKNDITLVFLNRSEMPSHSEWDVFLTGDSGSGVLKDKISFLKKLEERGTRTLCLSGDVSDYGKMEEHIDGIRKQYGNINGIIHCAGIAGEGFLIKKDIEQFEKVLSPKLDGTWILNDLTKRDAVDFFILFSSVLSLTCPTGQSDYAAANAYLNGFSSLLKRKGRRGLSINWGPWGEVGMARNLDPDLWGIIKPLSSKDGIHAFEEVLNRPISHVVVNSFDYEKLSLLKQDFGVEYSEELKQFLDSKASGHKKIDSSPKMDRGISVEGAEGEDLSEIQERIGKIFGEAIGLTNVSLSDSFVDLGGDSIIAARLLREIDDLYPGVIDLPDVFSYPTVRQMSEYLEGKLTLYGNAPEEEMDSESYDLEVQSIMVRLANNEISEEEADFLINQIKQ